MKQYATSACVRDRFDAHEWSRLLPASLHNGQKIVCCPEDLRCTACDVGNGQLCETCELPICHQCLVQMFDQRVLAVPQALANDNWYGYPTELLYKHKVRWIEAAAASPLWTSVVTYYVEADRGHLVEETLHRAEHRTAVRGNVSSFSLPWEEVLAAFAPEANTRMPWTKLPHEPKVMQQFVKITVKGMLHNEAIEWVAGARIRPWVVVALLQHLIDLQHPMCDNHISPEKAKEEVKQRVTQIYGTEETMPLGEAIPEDVPVAAPLSSAQASPKARPTQSSRSRPAAPKQSPPASARHSGQASKPVAAARPDAKLSKVAVDTASGDLARTPVSSTPTKLSVVASDNAQSIARGASIVVAADDTPCIAVVEVEGSEKTNSQTRTTTVEKYVPPVVSVAAVGTAKTLSASMHSPTSRDAPPQKHATPETAAAAALDGQAFTGVHRPNVLSQDYATSDWREPDLERLQELAHAADQVTVETGHTFWDQWQNDFLPWAFPFSLPAPVSGPDFPHKTRPRRPVHAPNLHPLAHLKLLAGRVESSIRNSWDFVPGLRRLTFKWQSVCNGILWRKRPSQRDCVQATPTASWVEAAKGLYSKLRSGTYLTASGQYKPIHFDTRKLPYAKGLTSEEHHLLQDVRSMQRNMPGTIESRRRIGRFLFGARVELGEPLFITISPTSHHNALYIKFSRYRQADPGSTVFGKRTCPEIWESANATMFVPPYDTRRQLTARDPWAVVLSFQTIVRCIFAKLLGIRMCFRCPACDCRDASGNGCHVTGGLFGLVRGLCGAIEYQTNSTPHFHCNVYSASIWQQPLHELAEKLNNRTIEFDDVKHFLTWIHPETHPDYNFHNAQQAELEAAWNEHNSHEKHDFLCHWPNFIQTDDAKSPWLDDMAATRAVQEAQTFIETYRRVAQSKVSHQQIHWHPYSIVQKCRLPISACRKKNAPNKCKHSFPKVQNDRGRVICRGNARKFGLSTAGRRNALGTILDKREDPWLSGTMYAFTLMLFGNSHTAVNFRVPLTAASHDAECARGCLAHNLLRKLQRAMAQAARRSTRYFTGYLQKPQPLGRKELQHAAKQLHFLETAAADDPAAQQRKVAHRVLGDLEFRCSTRPMTEEFMLAGFATSTEPTSAECIRSFPVVPFVGTEWLSILDNFTETRQRVKPSNPHSSTIKFSEVYGWRGTDPRVWFLSPWEFVKWWTVKKLQPPHGENAESDTGLSVWVNGAGQTKKPADGWKFGRDFVWKDSLPAARRDTVLRLPEIPQCQAAQDHYLERRREPCVPYPTVCPLPKPDMAREAQARLLNVYLRPWTLDLPNSTLHVPHIAALDLPFAVRSARRLTRIHTKSAAGQRSHHVAWTEYVANHIVSEHAARTIRNFIAATECDPEEADAIEPPSNRDKVEVDTSWVSNETIHRLITGVGFEYSKRSSAAVHEIIEEWKIDSEDCTASLKPVNTGVPNIKPDHSQSIAHAHTQSPPEQFLTWTYGNLTAEAAEAWLTNLQSSNGNCPPTAEQLKFLRAVIQRCLQEAAEEHAGTADTEPLRAIFHGVPGAGKSQTLKWLRSFFEDICHWEHQHQFVFVAPQNTQAALIGGVTLHAFANIRVRAKKASPGSAHTTDQFVKYQRLRWILVDETSTVGLEILATVEKKLQQSIRDRDTWKLRPGGEKRPFAGLNLILTGDLWQFPPVKATAIFQNPFAENGSFQVAALQKLFWTRGTKAMQHLFELTKEQRCEDPWLSVVLQHARHGSMTQEIWSFLHGFPTLHAGSWDFKTHTVECGQTTCADLHLQAAALHKQPLECKQCRAERQRRCLVGKDQKSPKFLNNPFVHGLNAAKYIAANLRARQVAATRREKLLWIVAQDTPLFHIEPPELPARRENWLQRHDQSTGGVVGLLPLLQNMPVRITQTLPELKPFGLFKNTRGTLWNWTLHEADAAAASQNDADNIVLQKMPLALYVHVPGQTWQQHAQLPPGVARLEAVTQTWSLETNGKATVSRRGFPLACDFAGTAHSFMGSTLEACTLDLGHWDSTASREAQLSGYMCLSRVRKAEDLCIAQPFSPNLFTNGELIGPHTFLEVHRGKLTPQEAKARFSQDKPSKKRNRDIMLFCRGCSPQPHRQEKLLPLREFVTAWDQDEWYQVLSEGMCRLCLQCKAKQSGTQPPSHSAATHPCPYCPEARPANKTGYCSECVKTERLACSRCDQGKKIKTKRLTDFDPEEVRRKKKTKELRRLRCKKCATTPVAATSKQGLCTECNKTVSVSHLTHYTAASQTGLCRACVANQARASKTCANCGQPLKASQTPGTWCKPCAYPPCTGGCGKPRPQVGKRRLHAKKNPIWHCPECQGKQGRCVRCEKVVAVPNLSNYTADNNTGTCKACVAKPKLCGNCAKPLPSTATAGTWCAACAYPPCPVCGRPRPDDRSYHVKVLPTWTCAECKVKPCSKCGQPLESQAIAETLCRQCSYPPCESCGHPRPQKSGYHVKVLPSWSCAECKVKPCSQCGQPLESQAMADTLCMQCSYPPCDACGQPRPQKSGYHVKDLPTWMCSECQSLRNYPPCDQCGRPRPQKSGYRVDVLAHWICAECRDNTQRGVPRKRRRKV